ncbi:G:T/U mismatch-specific DNA glycosylase [Bordetella hinzii]|uniref:DNA-deoxyinosine glycosylase n=1 Tax=Bordetella hinzii TaxID=103855 RepID=UPI00049645AD|nr:DNA-deoxyinosine glycosylase [Bordetella hinzii]AKQ55417.1 Uracil DNA glycosylase superfamily protein [Bordetella hinzii]SNV90711.1 G:T/U mismatch-specific DNA glycosylase [Bordetella hinzii]
MRAEATVPPLRGFAPAARADARILILGTMPGAVSLARGEYYAHARNAFWRIAQALFGVNAEAPYEDRLRALQEAGVALWDVLAACERPGSLDSAIVAASAVPNDFAGFLARHPRLEVIGLNGAKAAQLYRRHVTPMLAGRDGGLRVVALPSTSPAHAALGFEGKLQAWRRLLG